VDKSDKFDNSPVGQKLLPAFTTGIIRRSGKSFLVIMALLTQILTSLITIPAAFFIQVNAEFFNNELAKVVPIAIFGLAISNVVLLLWINLSFRKPQETLGMWSKGEAQLHAPEEELKTWRQITAFPWYHGIASALAYSLFGLLPLLGYMGAVLHVTSDQLLYTLMGGAISISIIVSLGILILEYALAPARNILLPTNFAEQLKGATGAKLLTKFQVIFFILIVVSILLVAPIGYHQTVTVLFNGVIGPTGVLQTLRVQTIIVAIVAIGLGFSLSLLLSRSVSDPLKQLIDVFQKVEAGDLKQRANILATDEVGELAIYFNRMISRLEELQGRLTKQVTDRTEQLNVTSGESQQRALLLEAISEVARAITQLKNVNELLPSITQLISQHLGFYHVGIFLLDDNQEFAILRAANSEGGQRMLSHGHRLKVGQEGIVGYVAQHGESRISLDVGEDAVFFDNPDLPDTRSEMGLPLMIEKRVIGVLDVQSDGPAAFGKQNIAVMNTLADQVAIAIENANLFGEMQRALIEAQVSYGQYVRQAWETLPMETRTFGYRYSGIKLDNIDEPLELPEILAAMKTGAPIHKEEDESVLAVPLKLRGEVIGVIDVRATDPDRKWTENELNLVQAIADRVAIALENARLFEETTRRADRERAVSEITTHIRSSTDPQVMLRTALDELKQVLAASDVQIRPFNPRTKELKAESLGLKERSRKSKQD
jgi:GAF domain-containing protein/HAMP domain-containing protein